MLKRLIEVALPLKEVSEQSAREKSIRHGHISTLHIWWARRPLAACRAAVFASLIPDPDDPECPDHFRKLVMETLTRNEFKPKNGDGSTVEDTPRNRCLEFIKYLVRWENSNKPEYIEPARKLIVAAHKFLHPDANGDTPKVLDPFAGGGAIPLEALRLGCEAHAVDLNPVAHLIELCTLVYPQKYGQADSRPVPEYVKRLIAHNRAKKKGEANLFDHGEAAASTVDEIIPDVEITEAEYRKNPLAADVKYWGNWVLEKARRELGRFYPNDPDGSIPIGYLWTRVVTCPNPTCRAVVPLLRQLWLCKKTGRNVALRIVPEPHNRMCHFDVVENGEIDFDPSQGNMQRGSATCPLCNQTVPSSHIKAEGHAGRLTAQMTNVVLVKAGSTGKKYRPPTKQDEERYAEAAAALKSRIDEQGASIIPDEEIPSADSRAIFVHLYGLLHWGDLFNDRQNLALVTFSDSIRQAVQRIAEWDDRGFAEAIGSYLGLALSRFTDFCSTLCTLNNVGGRGVAHTFTRQSLPMVWDYAETNPFNETGANWAASIEAAADTISKIQMPHTAHVARGSATALPLGDAVLQAVITDPPYYDAIPYSELSDYFYVWLKRCISDIHPDVFRTPLTPKATELIAYRSPGRRNNQKTPEWYEQGMSKAFGEAYRCLESGGICFVMFAHKTTAAWESIIAALLRAGLLVTGSWPFDTERPGRTRAIGSAALASSVTLVCRKRASDAGTGIWDDVRQELKAVAQERLDFFWNQGIRGADFFISAIGPALSVFGKYERVTKLSGEEVTVGQFLDEVRSLVSNYALTRILKTSHTGVIDPESRFYVVWKWSYADAKVPADESFKLSQALGLDTDRLWDRTGVLEKSGENVQATPVSKRMKIKNLGEPTADGAPASLIDVLHRLCAFRDKGDMQGMAQFLGRSGHANNHSLWLVAQAVSEILPDGEKEKQLMQGLLNQREGLEEATRQRELF